MHYYLILIKFLTSVTSIDFETVTKPLILLFRLHLLMISPSPLFQTCPLLTSLWSHSLSWRETRSDSTVLPEPTHLSSTTGQLHHIHLTVTCPPLCPLSWTVFVLVYLVGSHFLTLTKSIRTKAGSS